MGFFKRITATVTANVDNAIATMENHDAVLEASLADMRRASAKSKARLRRVEADGARLRGKLEQLETARQRWTTRAARHADSDEATALECLKRRRAAAAQRDDCAEALARHDTLVSKLSASIEKIDQRYRELDQTRTLMQTRERAAQAAHTIDAFGDHGVGTNIDDTLERWEARISEYEVDDTTDPDAERFEQTFIDEELRAELREELDALKNSSEESS